MILHGPNRDFWIWILTVRGTFSGGNTVEGWKMLFFIFGAKVQYTLSILLESKLVFGLRFMCLEWLYISISMLILYPWVIQKIKFDVFSFIIPHQHPAIPSWVQWGPFTTSGDLGEKNSLAARKLDIRSQWQLASSANILLGAHGAGLATWRNNTLQGGVLTGPLQIAFFVHW